MKTFRLFSMAAVALVMASCSSEDSISQPQTAQQPGKLKFTATVAAPGGDVTRTVYTEVTEGDDAGKINVAWKAGDAICITGSTYNSLGTVTVGTPAADGSAAISGTITGSDGDDVSAFYPATAITDDEAFYTKYDAQDGTLDYIQNNLDLRVGTGTLSVNGGVATLASPLKMESMIAIWKLTLQDNAATPAALAATKVTVYLDGGDIASTTDISGTSTVYLALPLLGDESIFSDIPLTIEATVGSDTYTYSKSGVTLARGKYYQSTVTMEKQAATPAVPAGAISGQFTINSNGDKVYFSKGNLRYASGTWSFFDNQYDYYTSYSADAWDKFGWSTSATTYGMNTSTSSSTYSGDFVDWGSNSNLQTALGTGWFTLSSDEWKYLFYTRSASTVGGTSNGRYAKAKVNNVQGMILFPDTYTHPDGVTAPTGVNAPGSTGWNGNNYSSADWTKMESAGCVFLPAAGYRYGSSVSNSGTTGYYWSATPILADYACRVRFISGDLYSAEDQSRNEGCSVRLVREVE